MNLRFKLWVLAEQNAWTGARPQWFWRSLSRLLVREGYGAKAIYETLTEPD